MEKQLLSAAAANDTVALASILARSGPHDACGASSLQERLTCARDHRGRTPLHLTSSFEISWLLLWHGARANDSTIPVGATPLHLCCALKTAVALLACGAEPLLADCAGRTAAACVVGRLAEAEAAARSLDQLGAHVYD